MQLDRAKISGSKLMFTIAFFLQSSTLLTAFIAGVAFQDSWISVVLGSILALPIIYTFRTLMVKFPGKNLVQMLEDTFGKVLGRIITFGYVWFFLNLTSLNVSDLTAFAKISVMTETPNIVLSLMSLLVVAMAVRGGARVITRYSAFFTFIQFIIVGLSVILLLNQVNFGNFLPMFEQPALKYIQTSHIITTIPIGELVVILMFGPNVKMSGKQATKCWFYGVGMGIAVFLVVMLRDIAILGNTLQLFTLPGLVSLRMVNAGPAIARVEILFVVALIMLIFFKVCILCYTTVMTICQTLRIKHFKHIVLPVTLLMLFYIQTIYPNNVAHTVSARTVEPIIWSLFEILIPITMLVIVSFKHRQKDDIYNKHVYKFAPPQPFLPATISTKPKIKRKAR